MLSVGNIDDGSEIVIARDSLEELLDQPVKLSVVLEPLLDADVAETNIEFESQINQIVRENIQSGTLIESVFFPGNPTIVFALISTDSDPISEPLASEIEAAETAMTEAAGLPVELQILTTEAKIGEEVESSNAALSEIIEKTLNESLQIGELVGFTFDVGNPFIVEVTIITELDPTSDEIVSNIKAVEEALSDALGIPVLLEIFIQPPGTVPTTPAVVPTQVISTPEPANETPSSTEEPISATEEAAPTLEASPTP
jgi:hypothetical protein